MHTLASSVSHDLRAPLRAILGYSGMLSEDLAAGRIEEVTEHAFRIERAARRMEQMIGALSRLSRAAHHALQLTSVDMAMQAREAWSLVTAAEPARQPTLLICDAARHRRWAAARAGLAEPARQCHQVLGSDSWAKVGVDAFAEDGRQWYRVTDNGVGFDMNDANHLFEPFRRLHAESDFAGIGIGLSIVRRIVRRHGGEIRARKRPERVRCSNSRWRVTR
ncbi:MAG: HAMP domain-containing histidine kinase [Comamonadaceae bacterium]|nr:HAMP domain-containing histidine kinase [Comamonadaceae bacterium]